ncbi:leucine-rich repeat extensin-like protein 5 [Xiphophorus hellerii]|uniref:leucine-rich repeat extensin-like protein 5 n=1 Tax=Xiphophorus hellerii TaxID=8084 RepID=UPI0013B40226|nr:leucine-rich repeat extensin-like protein 5 [Xiphophorus hellerii]
MAWPVPVSEPSGPVSGFSAPSELPSSSEFPSVPSKLPSVPSELPSVSSELPSVPNVSSSPPSAPPENQPPSAPPDSPRDSLSPPPVARSLRRRRLASVPTLTSGPASRGPAPAPTLPAGPTFGSFLCLRPPLSGPRLIWCHRAVSVFTPHLLVPIPSATDILRTSPVGSASSTMDVLRTSSGAADACRTSHATDACRTFPTGSISCAFAHPDGLFSVVFGLMAPSCVSAHPVGLFFVVIWTLAPRLAPLHPPLLCFVFQTLSPTLYSSCPSVAFS